MAAARRPTLAMMMADTSNPLKVWRDVAPFVTVAGAGKMLANPDSTSFGNATQPVQLPSQPTGTVRIVCIAETNSKHGSIAVPACDILLYAGNFSDGLPEVDSFCDWLKAQEQAKHKVVIAGDHDVALDPRKSKDSADAEVKISAVATYLNNTSAQVAGLKFFGTPNSPSDIAFGASRGEELRACWSKIPDDVDILISHCPPLGHGDMCIGAGHQGCADLLHWVEANNTAIMVVCGYIRSGRGVTTNGRCAIVNASSLDEQKANASQPLVFDIPVSTEGKKSFASDLKQVADSVED